MLRFRSLLVALVLCPTLALADAAEERAEELNAEGKRLFSEQKLEEALQKFRAAVVASPQGKYYFNVCFTLAQLGRYRDAIIACEAVEPSGGDDALLEKTDNLLVKLRESVAAQSGGGDTGGGGAGPGPGDGDGDRDGDRDGDGDGDTGPGDGGGNAVSGNGTPAVTGPPLMDLGQQGPPPIAHDYIWSLGFELAGLNNVGIGGELIDGEQRYGDGGGQFRFYGSYIFDHIRRIGGQAYFGYSALPDDAITIEETPLSLIDIGVAGFKHVPLAPSLYLTPLLGVHVSFQGPANRPETFRAVGARAELGLDWVLGHTGSHVVSLKGAVNAYTSANGNWDGFGPADFGLDEGGMTATLGVAYQIRFQIPLSQLAVINLE